MFAPASIPSLRDYQSIHNDPGFEHKKFFIQHKSSGRWSCILCDTPYEELSRARKHEDSIEHTNKVRFRDQPTALSSPFRGPSTPAGSRTYHRAHTPESPSPAMAVGNNSSCDIRVGAAWSGRLEELDRPLDSEASPTASRDTHMVEDPADLQPRPWAGMFGDGTTTSQLEPASSPITIHGPALPTDSEDQLYDNWGGELALEEADGDESDLRQCLTSALWPDLSARPGGLHMDDTLGKAVDEHGDSDSEEEPWEQPSNPMGQPSSSHLGGEPPAGSLMPGSDQRRRQINPIRPSATLDDPFNEDRDARFASQQHLLAPSLAPELRDNNAHWPWPDEQTCLTDVMGAFPRALFSEAEIKASQWYARKNGARKLPSMRQVKKSREAVINVAGANSRTHKGGCGHLYTTNDMEVIIRHDWANPLVRPHIAVYPEDANGRLSDARHGARWLHEVDPDLAAPMARGDDGRDYFVNEFAMYDASGNGDLEPVVVQRWFMKLKVLYAVCCPLRFTKDGAKFVIDRRPESRLHIPLSAFRKCVVDLEDPYLQESLHLPPPSEVAGILCSNDVRTPLDSWNMPVRNPWRERAKGRPVYASPIWMYCDDTSGNVSKKWNKHNSILFTLGGLPRERSQQLYNVHFLSTSNLASPLEMMEEISRVLRHGRDSGIEVWDCEIRSEALVIPWALAFQGDNPMASEFSSHIGMTGRCICRICHLFEQESPTENAQIMSFLREGEPRTREQTMTALKEQRARAMAGAPSAINEMGTKTGIKDKYLQHFVDEIQVKLSKWREDMKNVSVPVGITKKEMEREMLNTLQQTLPENIFNPVLQIPDFDAHSDSPVEILHVVLLGVVKYWWRDAVSRQNAEGKATLKTRLTSLDVSGLGIPSLRGQTLVQHAGSLVGRDFRVVLQVAPAVLHGLVSDAAYEAWLCLSRLAPLLFQPEIDNVEQYSARLRMAITDFLLATVLWTPQWFNKPKFHLFVHLLEHIRRFGPAMLYSTETFESYNLVIRLRSVNSNKQAPSLDIARSFSHMHAVRHLASGGFVTSDELGNTIPPRQAGRGVLALLDDPEFCSFMCIREFDDPEGSAGCYRRPDRRVDPNRGLMPASQTLSSSVYPQLRLPDEVISCTSIVLRNGDTTGVDGYIICQTDQHRLPVIGIVKEILIDAQSHTVLGFLIGDCSLGPTVLPYRLPACRPKDTVRFVVFEEILGAVNTIHNCAAHGCAVTRTRAVRQERELTTLHEDEIKHDGHPNDRLLNLAQLRNTALLQALWTADVVDAYPNMTVEDAVTQAINDRDARAAQAQKKKEEEEQKKAEKALAKARKQEEAARKRALAEEKNAEASRSGAGSLNTGTSTAVNPQGKKRKRNQALAAGGEHGVTSIEGSSRRPRKRLHTGTSTSTVQPALSSHSPMPEPSKEFPPGPVGGS